MKALVPAVVAGLAAAALAPGPAIAKRRPCAAKGSTTVKDTRGVRVWSRIERDDVGGRELAYYGCLKRVGRQVPIAVSAIDEEDADASKLQSLRVAGHFVVTNEAFASDKYFSVWDLRRRKRVRQVVYEGRVRAYALTEAGGLAVLEGNTLTASDAAEEQRVIDTGAIEPRSLRAGKRAVSWVRSGKKRSIVLR